MNRHPWLRSFRPICESLEPRRVLSAAAADPTFGDDGFVRTDLGAAVAVQADGTLVVAGTTAVIGHGRPSDLLRGSSDFAVRRFGTDGTADAAFATDGRAEVDFGGADFATALATQPDGKIVVAGVAFTAASRDIAVARLNTDGSLDASFGTGGRATIDIAGRFEVVTDVAVAADGKIVVVGSAFTSEQNADLAVVRLNADGSLDTTFNGDGKVTTDVGNGLDQAAGVVALADGRIVVTGTSVALPQLPTLPGLPTFDPAQLGEFINGLLSGGGLLGGLLGGGILGGGLGGGLLGGILPTPSLPTSQVVVVRYGADGAPDASFAGDGVLTLDLGGQATAASVVVQADGKVAVAANVLRTDVGPLPTFTAVDRLFDLPEGGVLPDWVVPDALPLPTELLTLGQGLDLRTLPVGSDAVVARFNADGSPDAAFGRGGRSTLNFGPFDRVAGLVQQTDGKLIVAGASGPAFSLTRLQTNGALDTTFGDNGQVTSRLPAAPTLSGDNGLALDANGNVVVVGLARRPSLDGGFVLGRFDPDAVPVNETPNLGFVRQLYQDILQRDADAVGLAYWAGLLDGGLPRNVLTGALMGSDEYLTNVVQELYVELLDRPADPLGLQASVAFLRGQPARQLEQLLLTSQEYFLNNGGSNAGFVASVYEDIVARPVDAGGALYWGRVLTDATSRAALVQALLGSAEAAVADGQEVYLELLNRPLDEAARQAFIGFRHRNLSEDALLALVVGSEEYFRR